MRFLMAGLPDREAAVLEAFIGMSRRGATCERLRGTRLPASAAAAGDHCIVDLSGLDMPAWSVDREARLKALLDGRSAVIIVPPGEGGGWLSASSRAAIRQPAAWVQKPCTTEAVRAALDQILGGSPTQAVASPALSRAGWRPSLEGLTLATGAIAALDEAFPQVRQKSFLRLLTDALDRQRPCELRVSNVQVLIVEPRRGWVASSVPPSLLARLARGEHPAEAILVREFSEAQACERARALGPRQELGTFMWQRCIDAWRGGAGGPASRDLAIRLDACPDFTRLAAPAPVHLQLAAICLKTPQSFSALRRLFPRHDAADIALFFVGAVLSGAARVLPLGAAPQAAPAVDPSPRRRGFFRALLDKLF
ncbi:MAG: hypothetical protein J7549_08015 [Variovorax sp.]|nr:hypothetical protein [Variovorax sp.]